jgi:hypothetical protein
MQKRFDTKTRNPRIAEPALIIGGGGLCRLTRPTISQHRNDEIARKIKTKFLTSDYF